MLAAGTELIRRGHKVTIFNIADVAPKVLGTGVDFVALGAAEHPVGSLQAFMDKVSKLEGLEASRVGLKAAIAETGMLLDEAPEQMRRAGVTALIADEGEPCGSTIAARLGLPFFTICNGVAITSDPAVPPTFVDWPYDPRWLPSIRNRAVTAIMFLVLRSLKNRINLTRREWVMPPLRSLNETVSPLAQFSQQTEDFDFPDRGRRPQFHFIGMLERATPPDITFPYDLLNGKPLVYCSFGTFYGNLESAHRCVAEACAPLDVQLILANVSDTSVKFPGDPITVGYAPQLELLRRSTISICHGGLNSVLESLVCGVPTIAIPISNDQFGVAARLRRSGAGDFIPLKQLSAARLQAVLQKMRSPEAVRHAAKLRDSIQSAGGTSRMADIIEDCLARLQ